MPFVRLDTVHIHYQVFGDAPGKPVLVFSNSLGTDFRIWREVISAFVKDFKIIAYDKRGHGLSDVGNAPYSMDDHIDDLKALLDYLKVDRVSVCGLSVGGIIAQGFAIRYPERVNALVLSDTAHRIGNAELWNSRIDLVNREGIAAISGSILERWFSAAYRSPDNPEFAGYRNMLERTTVNGYAGTCAAIRDTDYTEASASISVPALCIVGTEDGSTPPALVKELSGIIKDSRYVEIEGAGHLPNIEKPGAVAAAMKDFFASAGVL